MLTYLFISKLFSAPSLDTIESLDFTGFPDIEKIYVELTGDLKSLKTEPFLKLKEFTFLSKKIANGITLANAILLTKMDIFTGSDVRIQNLGKFLSSGFRIRSGGNVYITDDIITDLILDYNIDYRKLYIVNSSSLKSINVKATDDIYSDKINVENNSELEIKI